MHDGPRDYASFKRNGEEYFDVLVRLSRLAPHHRVLDVGSGIGRKTIPLLGYLDTVGSYEGLDVVRKGVNWCNERVGARHPNFRFHHADVFNGKYNPGGKLAPSEYRFPYGDAEFDRVILASVFTHMLQTDMSHYLSEVRRVLKPGGRSIITYFLLNSDTKRLMHSGKSSLSFETPLDGGCMVVDARCPEDAIAYSEDDVLSGYANLGMAPELHYGSWCGRENYLTYQDVIIATRE